MFRRIVIAVAVGACASGVMITMRDVPLWCMLLTAAQSIVYYTCSKSMRFCWDAGLALQPPWATYSLLTHQPAFVVTAVIIAMANVGAIRRSRVAARSAGRSLRARGRAKGSPGAGWRLLSSGGCLRERLEQVGRQRGLDLPHTRRADERSERPRLLGSAERDRLDSPPSSS